MAGPTNQCKELPSSMQKRSMIFSRGVAEVDSSCFFFLMKNGAAVAFLMYSTHQTSRGNQHAEGFIVKGQFLYWSSRIR